MLIKKYKTLKSVFTLFHLNSILRNSFFFCLLQTKHLNHNEWVILKQYIHPLNLRIFTCKNTFLRSNNMVTEVYKPLWSNLNSGYLMVLYSYDNLNPSSINKLFSTELLLKNIKLSPLIFYFLNRFFFTKEFAYVSKMSIDKSFSNLICLLRYRNYLILNKLLLGNKLFLLQLKSI